MSSDIISVRVSKAKSDPRVSFGKSIFRKKLVIRFAISTTKPRITGVKFISKAIHTSLGKAFLAL